MPIEKCRECKSDVSTEANTCPACGCDKPTFDESADRKKLLLIAGVIVALWFGCTRREAPPTTPTPIAAHSPVVAKSSPAPEPVETPLSEAAKKADAAVARLKYEDFCRKLGPALRSTAKNTDMQDSFERAARTKYGMSWDHLGGIALRQPALGMDLCAVIATFGRPDAINSTTSRHGRSDQVIYRERGLYLYMDNNRLTAWQD